MCCWSARSLFLNAVLLGTCVAGATAANCPSGKACDDDVLGMLQVKKQMQATAAAAKVNVSTKPSRVALSRASDLLKRAYSEKEKAAKARDAREKAMMASDALEKEVIAEERELKRLEVEKHFVHQDAKQVAHDLSEQEKLAQEAKEAANKAMHTVVLSDEAKKQLEERDRLVSDSTRAQNDASTKETESEAAFMKAIKIQEKEEELKNTFQEYQKSHHEAVGELTNEEMRELMNTLVERVVNMLKASGTAEDEALALKLSQEGFMAQSEDTKEFIVRLHKDVAMARDRAGNLSKEADLATRESKHLAIALKETEARSRPFLQSAQKAAKQKEDAKAQVEKAMKEVALLEEKRDNDLAKEKALLETMGKVMTNKSENTIMMREQRMDMEVAGEEEKRAKRSEADYNNLVGVALKHMAEEEKLQQRRWEEEAGLYTMPGLV